MKTLKYGFFGEDEAHRIFLENYLQQLIINLNISEELSFHFDKEFTYRYRGYTKADVDTRFREAVQVGLDKYQQDIFFVARDLDSFDITDFNTKIASMQSQLQDNFLTKTILMIPVQCIEHWLLYLKLHFDNPTDTKNVTLERTPRRDAKLAVYGNVKASNKVSIPIVEGLTSTFDIEHLESRSASFRIFHNQVKSFIETL